ncbi:MAG: hypothetical protein R6V05_04155 [Candidatus Brocadiia bacterium]
MTTDHKTVRDYLRTAFRRKWALLVPLVLGLLAGALMVGPLRELIPPKYLAEAWVLRKDLSVLRSAPSSLVSHEIPSIPLEVFRAEILTPTILDRVLIKTKQDVDLDTPTEWQEKHQELRDAIQLRAQGRGRGQYLIAIQVLHRQPEVAQQIANAVADTYVERSVELRRRHGQHAVDFFTEEENDYLAKLHEVEEQLDEYRQEHYADLPEVRSGIQSRLLSLRIEKAARERQLREATQSLEEVEKQLEELPLLVKSEVTTGRNPRVAELEDSIAARERALERMLNEYTEEHPDVVKLRRDIASLKGELAETPERLEGTEKEIINPVYQERVTQRLSLKQEVRAHQAALATVDAQIAAAQGELEKVADEEQDYRQLVRKQQEYSQLYSQWSSSLNRERINLAVADEEYGRHVEVHTRALVPAIPIRPDSWKIALACLVAGLVAGVSATGVLEYCDHSFRSMEDAAGFLEMPVLASIAHIPTARARAQRRRRLLAVTTSVVGLLAVIGIGIYVWDTLQPDQPVRVLKTVGSLLTRFLGKLTG